MFPFIYFSQPLPELPTNGTEAVLQAFLRLFGSTRSLVQWRTLLFLATDTDLEFKKYCSILENTMEPQVEIYTWSLCPFCIRAKALLDKKGVEFTEYCIDGDEAARAKMTQRANGRSSLPQIFINNQHIGGCDDMYALDARGKLDALLGAR